MFVVDFVVKYRLPSVFFTGNARLPTLLQSLESLPANVLDVPEACGLHSSPEVSLVLVNTSRQPPTTLLHTLL